MSKYYINIWKNTFQPSYDSFDANDIRFLEKGALLTFDEPQFIDAGDRYNSFSFIPYAGISKIHVYEIAKGERRTWITSLKSRLKRKKKKVKGTK